MEEGVYIDARQCVLCTRTSYELGRDHYQRHLTDFPEHVG